MIANNYNNELDDVNLEIEMPADENATELGFPTGFECMKTFSGCHR